MALAELTRSTTATASAPDIAEVPGDVGVRLEVHDASRVEWTVSVPLPERHPARYRIDVELEIPANVFARHAPWEKLQSWTRLDGAGDAEIGGEAVTIDALRRGAVSFAHRLGQASDGFARHCRLAGAVFHRGPRNELEEGLELWLGVARATAEEARERLVTEKSGDGDELRRERGLVDEYVSVRFLEMLAAAERVLGTVAV